MTWLGIKTDTTPVDDTPGAAEEVIGVRLRKQGEMQRRWGFLSTSIAKQAGPIRYIVASNRPSNNFVTLGVDGTPQGFSGGGGNDPWPPPPGGPKKRRPKGDRQGACTLWGPFGDSGSDAAGPLTFTLPASSCPGTIIFSASEAGSSGGSGASSDYGYSAVVTADGVPILTTGCLVNNGAGGVIPAGTLSIGYTITAGCAGGTTPGSWIIQATCP
jgi:hypothetical protein